MNEYILTYCIRGVYDQVRNCFRFYFFSLKKERERE